VQKNTNFSKTLWATPRFSCWWISIRIIKSTESHGHQWLISWRNGAWFTKHSCCVCVVVHTFVWWLTNNHGFWNVPNPQLLGVLWESGPWTLQINGNFLQILTCRLKWRTFESGLWRTEIRAGNKTAHQVDVTVPKVPCGWHFSTAYWNLRNLAQPSVTVAPWE
jgi:hypothetical protein